MKNKELSPQAVRFLTGFFAVCAILALGYIGLAGYEFGVWLK